MEKHIDRMLGYRWRSNWALVAIVDVFMIEKRILTAFAMLAAAVYSLDKFFTLTW